MSKSEKIRVLIADDDQQWARSISEYLNQHGFEAKRVSQGLAAKELVMNWKPKIVLADLMLPELNALQLSQFIQTDHALRHLLIHTIVVSGHNSKENVRLALKAGAKDYIVKPCRPIDVCQRLILHCRKYRQTKPIIPPENSGQENDPSLMLHLIEMVLREAIQGKNLQTTLFDLVQLVSTKLKGLRCSVVQCIDELVGQVVVSNDDIKASGISLNLQNYPEVTLVHRSGQLMAIENIAHSPDLSRIKHLLMDLNLYSMIICPIFRYNEAFGVLSLRMPEEKEFISDHEIRFVEIVAHIVSLILSNKNITQQEDFWRFQAHPAKILSFNGNSKGIKK